MFGGVGVVVLGGCIASVNYDFNLKILAKLDWVVCIRGGKAARCLYNYIIKCQAGVSA